MAEKVIKGVIVPRHDTAINWSKAVNFVPKDGELIVFTADNAIDVARGYYVDDHGVAVTSVNIKGVDYDVTPSEIVRFKFGNNRDNVNALPFVTTDNSGNGEGISADWIKAYVAEYVAQEGTVVLYRSPKEYIGRNIELQDVYPVQDESAVLEIVPKNLISYLDVNSTVSDITVISSNSDTPGVAGRISAGGIASQDITNFVTNVASAQLITPGKYTISATATGSAQSRLTAELYNDNTLVHTIAFFDGGNPVTFDSRELNVNNVQVHVNINCTAESEIDFVSDVQLEYGEKQTRHIHGNSANTANILVDIYSRNLLDPTKVFTSDGTTQIALDSIPLNTVISASGAKSEPISDVGTYYIRGTATHTGYIPIGVYGGPLLCLLEVPLYAGDDFTVIFSISKVDSTTAYIVNPQVVYGHTDYEDYCEFTKVSVVSDANGKCNIDKLQYPYSFLNIADVADGAVIHIKYDPALSRDWTEKQLTAIDKRLDAIEDGNLDINLDNYATNESVASSIGDVIYKFNELKNDMSAEYATKSYVSTLVDGINDDIIVSETEPTVTDETIWLQPVTEDTGAVDYIIESGIQGTGYYEKWNSGIVKYYIAQTETVDGTGATTKVNYLTIPQSICKSIITHNVSVSDLGLTHNVNVVLNGIYDTTSTYTRIKYTMFFASFGGTFKTNHAIIGTWK